MPVTKQEEQLAKETVELLQRVSEDVTGLVRISPKRMEAMHKMSRMRMTLNINGKNIQLVEDRTAPSLEKAIDEAMPKTPEPKCNLCGGPLAFSTSGKSAICLNCDAVFKQPESQPCGSCGQPWHEGRCETKSYALRDAEDSQFASKDAEDSQFVSAPHQVVLASERAREGKVN